MGAALERLGEAVMASGEITIRIADAKEVKQRIGELEASLRLCVREIIQLSSGSVYLSYSTPIARWLLGEAVRPPSLGEDWIAEMGADEV